MVNKEFVLLKKVMGLVLILGSTTFLTTSCYYDNEEELYPVSTQPSCDTLNVSYNDFILPLLESKCYTCHDQSSSFGNVNIEGYDNLKTYVDNGLFGGAIAHLDGFSKMPKGGSKLPDCDLSKIQAWINAGVPNN